MEAERNDPRESGQSTSRPPRPPPPQIAVDFNSYQNLQQLHDKSFHFSSQGLTAEENNDPNLALTSYKQSLELMVKALSIDCEHLKNGLRDQKDKGKLLQQKMTKSQMQIEYRIQELEKELVPQPSQSSLMELDSPPSYDEAMNIGDSIMSMEAQSNNTDSLISNAEQLFMVPEGVQIFFITREGFVSAPSYPATLRLCKFSEEASVRATNAAPPPPAFLQVGNWIYPLIPDTSPALQTSYGAYIFPDTLSQVPGSSVGVMLPDSVSAPERQTFEHILSSLTMMQAQQFVIHPQDLTTPTAPSAWEAAPSTVVLPPQPVRPPQHVIAQPGAAVMPEEVASGHMRQQQDTSTKISRGITVAADWITWGLEKGAEKTGDLIKFGSQKLQKTLHPENNPRPVDPKVQKGVVYARKATHAAVSVSSYLVTKLGEATVALGRELAPHIKKQGEKILPKSLSKEGSDGKSKMSGVLEVAASGVKGFGTVFMGLETAAKSLAKNIANETVTVVTHKYGQDAGNVTDNTLYAVGNVAMAAYNVDNLGVKAIAKRAAKETGKAVINKYSDEHRNDNQSNSTNQTNGNSRTYPKLPEEKM